MYITSGGDPTKAESAKKNLIWAITGIVVILLAYVIVQWVGNILNYGSTATPSPAASQLSSPSPAQSVPSFLRSPI